MPPPSSGLNKIFFLSSQYGAFPFSFSSENLSINYKAVIVCFFLRALFIGEIICFILPGTYANNDKDSHIGSSVFRFDLTLQYFASLSSVLYLIWSKREFELLTKFEFDTGREFEKLGFSTDLNVGIDHELLVFSIASIFYGIILLLTDYEMVTLYAIYKSAFVSYVVSQSFAMVQPFLKYIKVIGNQVVSLGEIFSALCQTKHDPELFEKLDSTIQIYNMLCSTSELLVDLFSKQLMFMFFTILLNFVVAVYEFLITLFANDISIIMVKQCLILIQSIIMCLYITTYCKNTSNKAKNFNTLLSKTMITDKDGYMSENIKLRLHVLMNREIVFNACGFFDLDYTLVHSVLAAATTYLFILIQFGQQSNSTPTPRNDTLVNSSSIN